MPWKTPSDPGPAGTLRRDGACPVQGPFIPVGAAPCRMSQRRRRRRGGERKSWDLLLLLLLSTLACFGINGSGAGGAISAGTAPTAQGASGLVCRPGEPRDGHPNPSRNPGMGVPAPQVSFATVGAPRMGIPVLPGLQRHSGMSQDVAPVLFQGPPGWTSRPFWSPTPSLGGNSSPLGSCFLLWDPRDGHPIPLWSPRMGIPAPSGGNRGPSGLLHHPRMDILAPQVSYTALGCPGMSIPLAWGSFQGPLGWVSLSLGSDLPHWDPLGWESWLFGVSCSILG